MKIIIVVYFNGHARFGCDDKGVSNHLQNNTYLISWLGNSLFACKGKAAYIIASIEPDSQVHFTTHRCMYLVNLSQNSKILATEIHHYGPQVLQQMLIIVKQHVNKQ